MSTIKRKSRRRTEGDPIARAWDTGDKPPDEAYLPENHDALIDCLFFRWAEQKPDWTGQHHPHSSLWFEALRASR